MKTYKYKIVGLLVLLAFSVQAQKFDKKVTENFKVNSDAVIVINAMHTDVDIETWNKNEVSIEAVMEVEGVSKEEAEKIFDKWKFEALSNDSKVEIKSFSDGFQFEFDGDFDFDFDFNFDFPEIDIEAPEFNFDFDFDFPEMDIEVPHFEMPDIDFPEIEIPEMEFDYQMYKNDSTYLKKYKMKIAEQVNKFKNSDWKKKMDSMKNSDEYKMKMAEFKKSMKEMQAKIEEYTNSEDFKRQLEEANKVSEEVRKEMLENKEMWKEQAQIAKEASKKAMEKIKKMKEEGKFDEIKNHQENFYFNYSDGKNSKIKVKKYLKIKVPKKATFDLNVRHGKLNVPNSSVKMSANISYGNFVAGIISGDQNKLEISNSPVVINTISSGNITLKNVPKATFGTFSKANLFSNSSDVFIDEIGNDVSLSQKFGKLKISDIDANFNTLNLILDSAKADLNFSNSEDYTYQINSKNSSLDLLDKLTEVTNKTTEGVKLIEGFYSNKSSQNKVLITGVYSSVKLY
jgi:hypothetical protein